MGTSAFDLIGKQPSKDPSATNTGGSKSAFDIISKPVAKPKVEEPATFSNTVGNLGSYIGSVFGKYKESWIDAPPTLGVAGERLLDYTKHAGSGAYKTLENVDKTLVETADSVGKFVNDTPISQMPTEIINKVGGMFQSLPSAGSMASGLVDQFVTAPIEAATQLKNVDGVAMPMTSNDLAQRYQSVAGTLAMAKVAKGVSGTLLDADAKTAQAALAAQRVSRVGKLAKVVGADAVAGSAAGFTQGAIAGLGSENDIENSIAGALTFLPIGAALGIFGVKKYSRSLDENVGRLVTKGTFDGARDLAALNSLRATDHTSMLDLANNIDAINTSNSLVDAAIKAKLKVGKGYIIQGFEREEKLPDLPGAFAYHSPVNNTLLASPYKLNSATEAFFQKTGFIPREVVNFGGDDHYVVGSKDPIPSNITKVKRLTIRNINTGQEAVVPTEALRRSNTSLVSSEFRAADAKGPASSFETSKGSTYQIQDDGTTIRNKSAHPEHPGDVGIKPKSKATYYVDQRGLNALSEVQAQGASGSRTIEALPDGRIGIKYTSGPDAGKFEGRSVVKPYKNPSVGLTPVEVFDDGIHFGNDINKVVSKENPSIGVARVGLLNAENFASTLADKFVQVYKKSKGSDPFDKVLGNFAQTYGIKVEEHPDFQAIVFKKLSDDLAKDHLSPKEQLVRKRITQDLTVLNEGYQNVLTNKVAQGALSNGMYVTPDGAGRYNILDRQSSNTLATVGSSQEALNFINASGQAPLHMLDGGTTGGVPTNLGNLGGMVSPYRPEYPKLAQVVDRMRTGGVISKIVPAVRFIQSVDNITQGATSLTRDVMLPLQDLQNQRRNFTIQNESITKSLNQLHVNGLGLTPEQLEHVANARETFTPEEIKASYLSRPMLKTEIQAASTWFKGTTVKDVNDLMYSARKLHNFEIGTPEFDQALKLIAEAPDTRYNAKTLQAATNLSAYAKQFTPNLFSLQAVTKLAKALEDPATALSRQDYAAQYFDSPKQHKLLNTLNEFYNKFDIPDEQKIAGYLPDIVINNAISTNTKGGINPTFARELTRAGITPDNLTIRDPLEQAKKYYYSYLNSKSGFLDGALEVEKKIKNNIEIMSQHPDPAVSSLARPIAQKLADHLDDVMGRPKADEQLSKISQALLSKMGIKTPDVGSVLAVFSLSNLGLRFGLAIRDMHNALGQAYIRYGHEFAEKAFSGALSDSYLKALQEKGILPRQDAMAIIDPSNSQGFLGKETLTGKVAAAGFKWSGQEQVYNRTLAGLYKATFDTGIPILEQLRKNEITKVEAYKKLGLNIEGPTVSRIFDDLLTAGKPDQALDLLGRWRGRTTSTLFGNNNNPIGWKSPVGRLLGQYGAWSTNSFNTMLENASYGDKGEISQRVLRSGIVYGATAAAGAAMGLDLHKWQFENPFEVIPGVGPVSTLMHDAINTYGKDPDALHAAFGATEGVLKNFVPYRKFVSDWQSAYENSNPMIGVMNAPPAK